MNAPAEPTDSRREHLRLVTVAWMFGAVWAACTGGAPLTRFGDALGLGKFEFGILAAMPFFVSLLALPASLLIEHSGERKRLFFIGLLGQRVTTLLVALVPAALVLALGRDAAAVGAAVFLPLMLVMHASGALGGPAWVSWMGDVVPARLRGRYFSRRRQWGILTAVPAALAAGWVLDGFAPHGSSPERTLVVCSLIFLPAGVLGIVDILLFKGVPHRAPARPAGGALRSTFAAPLRDRDFVTFSVFVALMTMSLAPMGQFLALFCHERLGVGAGQVQLMLIVAPMLGQLLVLPWWGRLADRFGRKPLVALSSLGLVPVGFAWTLVGAETAWLGYALATLAAMLVVGIETANMNLALQFGTRAKDGAGGGSGYVAVNSVFVNVAGCAGGLLAGTLMAALSGSRWNYEALFVTLAGLRLAAVVGVLPFVREPTARATGAVLRLVVDDAWEKAQRLARRRAA